MAVRVPVTGDILLAGHQGCLCRSARSPRSVILWRPKSRSHQYGQQWTTHDGRLLRLDRADFQVADHGIKKEARARHADTRRVITHLRSTLPPTPLCLCCFWTESSQEWRRAMISLDALSSHSPSAAFDGTPQSKPLDTGPPLQVCFSGLSEVTQSYTLER
jgi:hypothetical protein